MNQGDEKLTPADVDRMMAEAIASGQVKVPPGWSMVSAKARLAHHPHWARIAGWFEVVVLLSTPNGWRYSVAGYVTPAQLANQEALITALSVMVPTQNPDPQ